MAYYSGSANSFANLLSALQSALAANGWSSGGGGWMYKGAVNVNIAATATALELRGSGDPPPGTGNQTPRVVRLGHYTSATGLVFPVGYEIFVHTNPDEVYLVVNHSVDRYAWLAFGQSNVPVLGTGAWLGATSSNVSATSITLSAASGGGITGNASSAGLFCQTIGYWNSYVHHAFGDQHTNPWGSDYSSSGYFEANQTQAWSVTGDLCGVLPNSWNGESVLLPIQGYTSRPQSKVSLTVDLQHARYARIDNYEPSDIITLGSDRWKVFPWWRKNLSVRNGGTGDHTGTFGWAIRYDGP